MEKTPPWLRSSVGPLASYADMLFVDHGILRTLYLNRHRLSNEAWRSAQPAPHQIRALAKKGVRTIVNLRGERMCGSYWLEREACDKAGIKMVNYQVRSRAAPTREELHGARELFENVEY
ncbi:MAG: protein tyrosine phosphatase, partial [Pseudomonadota bacterium]